MHNKIILSLSSFVILCFILSQSAEARSSKHIKMQSPEAFLIHQTQKTILDAKSIPPRDEKSVEVTADANKDAWLSAIYSKRIVEASSYSSFLSDKLLMTRVMESAIGETAAEAYLPKTLGLKEFLERHQLVDHAGKLIADGDRIDSALHEEFPTGFFVRPAVGITPYENERGIFAKDDDFIVQLVKGNKAVYDPNTYWTPIQSHILGLVASGEAVVLQENIVLSAELNGPLRRKAATFIRLHTFENKIVPQSVPKRWLVSSERKQTEDQITQAEQFVQKFLNKLPESLLRRQAWSVEVAAFDNGTFRITNIITNRGKQIAWSTYLDEPRILKAYTNFFEANRDLHFEGFSGRVLRLGLANYLSYWKLRFVKAQGFEQKMSAAIPPWL